VGSVVNYLSGGLLTLPAGDYWLQVDGTKLNEIHVASGQFSWEGDLTAPYCAVVAMSPVDLEVSDANGFVIDKDHSTFAGASYGRVPMLHGDYHTVVQIPLLGHTGLHIRVFPAAGADPSATFSLYAFESGVAHELAKDVALSQIPAVGYSILASPLPAGPANVLATAVPGGLRLHWSAPSGTTPASYAIFYGREHAEEPYVGADAAEGVSGFLIPGSELTATLSCLPESAYAVAVAALDADGRQSLWIQGDAATPFPILAHVKLTAERGGRGGRDPDVPAPDPTLGDVTPDPLGVQCTQEYFDCRLWLGAGFSVSRVNLGSIRLGGVVPALLDKTSLGFNPMLAESVITTRFNRDQVEALLRNGGRQPVTVSGRYAGCMDTLLFSGVDTILVIKPRVVQPAGGQHLLADTDFSIQWSVPGELDVEYLKVLASTDAGATWSVLADRVPKRRTLLTWHTPAISSPAAYVSVEAYGDRKFLGSGTSPAFTISQGTLGTDYDQMLPKTVYLLPPTPTPFHGGTMVQYGLPKLAQVRLQVFDVGGRLVRTLVNGIEAPGIKSVKWNGTDNQEIPAGAGVYLLRLETGGTVKVQRAVLLR
jgi:hypothetical protein